MDQASRVRLRKHVRISCLGSGRDRLWATESENVGDSIRASISRQSSVQEDAEESEQLDKN